MHFPVDKLVQDVTIYLAGENPANVPKISKESIENDSLLFL